MKNEELNIYAKRCINICFIRNLFVPLQNDEVNEEGSCKPSAMRARSPIAEAPPKLDEVNEEL